MLPSQRWPWSLYNRVCEGMPSVPVLSAPPRRNARGQARSPLRWWIPLGASRRSCSRRWSLDSRLPSFRRTTQGIYVAGVRHILDPALYPLNADFPAAFTRLSHFPVDSGGARPPDTCDRCPGFCWQRTGVDFSFSLRMPAARRAALRRRDVEVVCGSWPPGASPCRSPEPRSSSWIRMSRRAPSRLR